MEKTKESRINVFIIRSRSKRKERREKNDLFSGFIYLLSYFNLDKIIKRETSQRVLFLSISLVMEISRVSYRSKIVLSRDPKLQNSQIAYATLIVTTAIHRHCQGGYANSHGGRYKQRDIGLLAVSSSQMFDIGVINPPLTPVDRYFDDERRRCIVAFQGISPSVDNNRLAGERIRGGRRRDARGRTRYEARTRVTVCARCVHVHGCRGCGKVRSRSKVHRREERCGVGSANKPTADYRDCF